MAEVKTRFTSDTTGFQKGVNQINSQVKGLAGSISGVVGSFAKIGALAVAGGAIYGVTKAITAITDAIRDSSKQAASFETLNVQLEVLTGSAEKASALLAEIREYGATTPLEANDLAEATKTLLAFDVNLSNVMPTLKMLGDISMGNAEKLKSLALVYGQVSSAGRLMGQDVLQMINSGFNPLIYIAEDLGMSMVDVKKKMEAGEISVSMVNKALSKATGEGGRFNGMLGRISNTFEGKLSNLADNITSLKIAFGTGFNDGLKDVLDTLNTAMPEMKDVLTSLGDAAGDFIKSFIPDLQEFLNTLNEGLKNGNFSEGVTNAFINAVESEQFQSALKAVIKVAFSAIGSTGEAAWDTDSGRKTMMAGGAAVGIYGLNKIAPKALPDLKNYLNLATKSVVGVPSALWGALGAVGGFTAGYIGTDLMNPMGNTVEATPYTPSLDRQKELQDNERNKKNMLNTIGILDEEFRRMEAVEAANDIFNGLNGDLLVFQDKINKFNESYKWQENGLSDLAGIPMFGQFEDILGSKDKLVKDADEKEKNKGFQLSQYMPIVKSLTRIGGGGSGSASDPLVSIQKQANKYLSDIVKNTSTKTTTTATFA